MSDAAVKYETKSKVFMYLGLIQSPNGKCLQVQYLKDSGEKTFSLRGDQDWIGLKSLLFVIK